MKLDNLRDVFYDQLKDVYSAEKHLMDALPSMMKAAHSLELQKFFARYEEETKKHYVVVREMLDALDVNPTSTDCAAMAGFIQEFEEIADQDGDPVAKDAAIIAMTQKIAHFGIASYGALRAWARLMDASDIASLLDDILDQEYNIDNALGRLAESNVNRAAMQTN